MLNTINDLWKSGEFIANYLKMGLRYYPTLVGAKGTYPRFLCWCSRDFIYWSSGCRFWKKGRFDCQTRLLQQ